MLPYRPLLRPGQAQARGLPKRPRGRQSALAQNHFNLDVSAFCQRIQGWAKELDFKVSSRGWGYILEGKREIDKGEIDAAQRLINDCRKSGLLPIDICAEDERRATDGIQRLDSDIDQQVAAWEAALLRAPDKYTPTGFWEEQFYYVEMAVEKIDLKSLFEPVCREFHVPIGNMGGWSDLWARTNMLVRMYLHWLDWNNDPVLLYCGDHDPGGLSISDFLRNNLRDMAGAAALLLRRDHGINVTREEIEAFVDDQIEIERFGLNEDFIEANNLTWIDNLETGSGGDLSNTEHRDHYKPYVQDYLARYGARKCEANALVVAPLAGRQLCREAILRYVDADADAEYQQELEQPREDLRRAIYDRFGVGEPPDDDPPPAPSSPLIRRPR